ncbi:unnamed protein product [Cuscuta campestris]|uniref:F-box domain-containing protein n=1 Tax=Cuscuta campestris TaxID=132261 RepID=A0A484MJN0_9ASTE|nr:unnamed protein product [Cuscuta campestris]
MAPWNRRGGLVSGLVRSHSFGRKRVALPVSLMEEEVEEPAKRHCCSEASPPACGNSVLESLPLDVLIRIVCRADHDDLKSLFHVSKAIREATVIAKKWHFEYSTPRKTIGFKDTNGSKHLSDSDAVEAPNAPKHSKIPKSRLSSKKLTDISVVLFTSDGVENWPRRGELFV